MSEHAWRSSASLAGLLRRALLNADIRAFFAARNVLEVETPILSAAGNTEPNIESFSTVFSGPVIAGGAQRWLRTSPEFALKRLLASGVGDCYELGRVFRNGENGARHNPEFSMLEWYRIGFNLEQLIDECVDLVRTVAHNADIAVARYTFADLYREYLGIDIHGDLSAMRAALGDVQIDPQGLTRDDWLDLLMTHCIQPAMPKDVIIAVRDFPSTQAALAKVRGGVALRFELYWGGYEIANGYDELDDATEQAGRFDRDRAVRAARAQPDIVQDNLLLAALPHMPPCCGVAMGVERLLMVLLGSERIADVLAFDFARS